MLKIMNISKIVDFISEIDGDFIFLEQNHVTYLIDFLLNN